MVGLTSAGGIISLLDESEEQLKIYALQRLNSVVDQFWAEISEAISKIYTLHQSDGRQRVWRLPREKYDVDCLVSTFKHGGGGVMVCGCFANNCLGHLMVIDGKINGKGYQELLRGNLLPFLNGPG
ncbi:8402_t:CDS:2 [Entrophospora sp. SA101]|nr:8402_t:CDS:2 [Entrophospora sp. SA101]